MKRHPSLRTLSDDHHGGLVWARRLRRAAAGEGDPPAEVAREFLRFWDTDTTLHFREEEEVLLPVRFTSTTRSNSSGVVSSKVAKSPTAARCTHVSSLPYSSTALSATAFTCPNSEVSAGTAITSPPPSLISSTRESSPSSLRA